MRAENARLDDQTLRTLPKEVVSRRRGRSEDLAEGGNRRSSEGKLNGCRGRMRGVMIRLRGVQVRAIAME